LSENVGKTIVTAGIVRNIHVSSGMTEFELMSESHSVFVKRFAGDPSVVPGEGSLMIGMNCCGYDLSSTCLLMCAGSCKVNNTNTIELYAGDRNSVNFITKRDVSKSFFFRLFKNVEESNKFIDVSAPLMSWRELVAGRSDLVSGIATWQRVDRIKLVGINENIVEIVCTIVGENKKKGCGYVELLLLLRQRP
jgi:hypothetical protein